jgi:hypothetical protein
MISLFRRWIFRDAVIFTLIRKILFASAERICKSGLRIAGVRLLTAPEITNQRKNEMSQRGPYHKRDNINETNFPFSSGLRESRDGAAALTGFGEEP